MIFFSFRQLRNYNYRYKLFEVLPDFDDTSSSCFMMKVILIFTKYIFCSIS